MKKKGIILMIAIIVVIILYIVNPFTVEVPTFGSKTSDITDTIKIDDKELKVTYYKGNLIDEKVSYNNTYEKIISIENDNKDTVSYSIKLSESSISDDKLTYSLYASTSKDSDYQNISEEKNITGDYSLKYNLGIESGKTCYIKIVFKAYNEEEATTLKGKVEVASNLTKKDIFANDVTDCYNKLVDKIESLNGIRWANNYTIDISNLGINDLSIQGVILVDATDISSLDYYFTVYNDSYMLKEYKYTSKFSKAKVKDIDYNVLGSVDETTICNNYTKKGCGSILDLTYNSDGSKKEFKEAAETVIDLVKEDFNKDNKAVVIYNVQTDVINTTNVRGYILINNTVEEPEYYLYLTNDIFMISGYNLTKLGDFTTTSKTIRMYFATTFNQSADSPAKVCSFSGFSGCIDKNGNLI